MKSILITGGAGFIGSNAAEHFSHLGWDVTILDNLSRAGASNNIGWLRESVNPRVIEGDVVLRSSISAIVSELKPDVILHLAAQVAVTKSLKDPRLDFNTNALGTLNLLEAVRELSPNTFFINASSNKVYGDLDSLPIREELTRWGLQHDIRGISEDFPLAFHSPYGCSKGTADQYTLDYARSYGIRAVTVRQSCIYGPRQFGIEDQGWIAWFLICAQMGRPITIYGDGKQVRDALYIDDLLCAYELMIQHSGDISGHAFNIGGGINNAMSLVELINRLQNDYGLTTDVQFETARLGDQKIYISDVSKAAHLLGWTPKVTLDAGLSCLMEWIKSTIKK